MWGGIVAFAEAWSLLSVEFHTINTNTNHLIINHYWFHTVPSKGSWLVFLLRCLRVLSLVLRPWSTHHLLHVGLSDPSFPCVTLGLSIVQEGSLVFNTFGCTTHFIHLVSASTHHSFLIFLITLLIISFFSFTHTSQSLLIPFSFRSLLIPFLFRSLLILITSLLIFLIHS